MSLIDPGFFERRTAKQKLWMIGGALAALLVIVGILMWLYADTTKKEIDLHGNIEAQNGANAVIGNQVNAQEKVVTNAEINANKAGDDLNRSVNRPSNQFDGNRANDRFCRNFPNDPSCLSVNR